MKKGNIYRDEYGKLFCVMLDGTSGMQGDKVTVQYMEDNDKPPKEIDVNKTIILSEYDLTKLTLIFHSKAFQNLRKLEPFRIYDKSKREYVVFKHNEQTPFICWDKYISHDKRQWIQQRIKIRLKEAMRIILKISNNHLKN